MTRLVGTLLLAAVLPAVALAQRPDPTEKLLMVIKTDIDEESMTGSVKTALKALGIDGRYLGIVVDKEPIVTPITPAQYNAYAALENPNFKPVDVPTSKTGEVEVKQLNFAGGWEFNLLGDGEPVLRKLEVRARGEKEPLAFEPSRAKGSPLSMTVFGSYALKLDPAAVPEGYTATIEKTDAEGKTETVTDSGTWPRGSNYYLIRLEGFRSDLRDRLSATIKDPSRLGGAALKSFDIKTNVTLAVGDAEAGGADRRFVRFEGNRLYISVPPLNQPVSRAYILFPLSRQDAADKVTELNKLSVDGLSRLIQKEPVVGRGVEAVVTPGMKPVWIELPPITRPENGFTVGDFGRVITLGGKPGTSPSADEFKKMLGDFNGEDPHWVVVHEFENPASNIRNVVPASLKPGDPPLKANHEPMSLWSVTLSKLAGVEPKKEEK